jgi:hypothetical protein
MSKTRSRNSAGKVIALTAGGVVIALVGAALAQGVQPPAVQAGPGAGPHIFQGGTPGTLQPGAAAGALNAYDKGPAAAGAVDAFNKPGMNPNQYKPAFPSSGFGIFKAEPPPSPAKGALGPQGTKPAGAVDSFSPRDAASTKKGGIIAPDFTPRVQDCATGTHSC